MVTLTFRLAVGTAALMFVASLAAQQQLYRYTEPDGRVVYTDRAPPANAKNAQSKRIGANTIETSELTYQAQQATERFPVTLYTFDCGEICPLAGFAGPASPEEGEHVLRLEYRDPVTFEPADPLAAVRVAKAQEAHRSILPSTNRFGFLHRPGM